MRQKTSLRPEKSEKLKIVYTGTIGNFVVPVACLREMGVPESEICRHQVKVKAPEGINLLSSQPMSTRSPSTLTQSMAGLTLNDSNQAPSTPAEQTSGVLSQVSESEGLSTCPVPSGRIAAKELEKAYGVIRSMSHTLFRLPTGRAGNRFLDEMTRILNIYIDGTHGSQNAPYAFFNLPTLMLQKPSKNSKTKDNVNALQQRFELWCGGNVRELMKESKLLQNRMSEGKIQPIGKYKITKFHKCCHIR